MHFIFSSDKEQEKSHILIFQALEYFDYELQSND